MTGVHRIYDKLDNIAMLAGRTDARLQVVIDQQEKHDVDISKLKSWKSWILGAFAAFTALFTLKDRI